MSEEDASQEAELDVKGDYQSVAEREDNEAGASLDNVDAENVNLEAGEEDKVKKEPGLLFNIWNLLYLIDWVLG